MQVECALATTQGHELGFASTYADFEPACRQAGEAKKYA